MRILFAIFLLPLNLFSQPSIDQGGDNWAGKVTTSLNKIKEYDESSYNVILKSCDRISFWLGDFSSNVITKEGERTILISANEAKNQSINNISLILIHESVHLWVGTNNVELNPYDEEILCYSLELEYLKRIPDPEKWLIEHAETQIKKYKNQKTKQ